MSWRALWTQLNAAFLPNYHSWSAGGKTDAARCWLVHRHHTGLPLFLTDFSLSPWLHFYQQQSAWSQSQQLVFCKLREVKAPWSSRCPRRQSGLRCFSLVVPVVTDVDWHTASPDQLALTVNIWAWFGVYHEPGTFPSRKKWMMPSGSREKNISGSVGMSYTGSPACRGSLWLEQG